MKKKVYISSTMDLKEYRQAAYDCFNKLQPFFEFTRLAEAMIHDARQPETICLEEVAKADVYVLILGLRYGSEVPGKEISFTHSEYVKAAEAGNKKDILIFYAKNGIAGMQADVSGSDAFRKLEAFRTTVTSNHTSSFAGFDNVQQFENQLKTVLLDRVLGSLPLVKPFAVERRCNRYNTVALYREEVFFISNNGGHIFPAIFYARPEDCPNEFTDRLAFTEYGLPVKVSLTSAEFCTSSNPARQLVNIRRLIFEQLFPQEKNLINNPAAGKFLFDTASFLQTLAEKGVPVLFVEFVVDAGFAVHDIALLLARFAEESGTAGNGPQLHCCVSLRGQDDYAAITPAYDRLLNAYKEAASLKCLEQVGRDDIRTWIRRELQIDSDVKTELLIDCHFGPGNFSITMHRAQQTLAAMLEQLYYKKT